MTYANFSIAEGHFLLVEELFLVLLHSFGRELINLKSVNNLPVAIVVNIAWVRVADLVRDAVV